MSSCTGGLYFVEKSSCDTYRVFFSNLNRLVDDCNTSLGIFFSVILAVSLSSITFITYELTIVQSMPWMMYVKFLMFWAVMTATFLFWCYLGQKLEDSVNMDSKC